MKLIFATSLILLASSFSIEPSRLGAAEATEFAFTAKAVTQDDVAVALAGNTATAVCFLGTECPMARAYAVKLNQMHETFSKQGVLIVGVFSNIQDSIEDVDKYRTDLDVQFPLVKDEGNVLADKYSATRTPEVYLLDNKLNKLYHGRIDDQYAPGVGRGSASREDLKIAIEELLAGKTISVPRTSALGCIIGRKRFEAEPNHVTPVTFTNQVSRVLIRNCIECHRQGEIGPFGMEDYDEVIGWADTMIETIEQGRMPPWNADKSIGEFANARNMSEEDKSIIRQWINTGLHLGDPAQMPIIPPKPNQWQLSKTPDQVVEMSKKAFEVPAAGTVEYQYFVADPGFTEDKWISEAQVIPGDPAVVHHAIVFIRPPEVEKLKGVGWLTAYVPGQRLYPLPEGAARRVPAGSKFVFQMHYTPNGKEAQDITRVGFNFAEPAKVSTEIVTEMAINQQFEIPPRDPNYVVRGELKRKQPVGAKLLAVSPHMHFRGKSFELTAATNSGDSSNRPLLRVPNYDFNWQHTYHLSKPIDASDLGKVRFAATFDNSSNNPFNPNPDDRVFWGDQTWEEMAVAFFDFAVPVSSSSRDISLNSQSSTKEELDEAPAIRRSRIEDYISETLTALDSNSDGFIARSETDIVVRKWNFDQWDKNRDGIIDRDELRIAAEEIY